MTSCPCCSNQLLRHIRHQEVYWFCTSCWQEMPNLDPLLKNDQDWFPPQLKQQHKIKIFSLQYLNQQVLSST
jgi:hypothetical protein